MEKENSNEQEFEDIFEYQKPAGENWASISADEEDEINFENARSEAERLHDLEIQQDVLNSSLIALTSHFAQVQFRLKQIVDAPRTETDSLLKDLEQFAFRGIPEEMKFDEELDVQREKQKQLISKLKNQLEDYEKYAYETGEAGLPQSILLERQKIVIDQLRGRLNLEVDMDKLTVDDLRNQVDYAISQLVSPLKMKQHLIEQLKTQISDLERFINFLQKGEERSSLDISNNKSRYCPHHCSLNENNQPTPHSSKKFSISDDAHVKVTELMKKALIVLQMFAISQFGCGSVHFRKNSLKKHHWGDLRAELELAVDSVLEISSNPEKLTDSDYLSESEDSPVILCNAKLTLAVRKHLATSIRNLIQHGLMPVGQSNSIVPFVGCLPQRNQSPSKMHAWEVILKYYEVKNGASYNSTPARKLSQSFNLDYICGSSVSKNLLTTIGQILATHVQYKRSYNSLFKAFICAALNSRKLVTWLRLIFQCRTIIDLYYQDWSYISKTGLEDSLQSLDRLTEIKFDLPVDLAVRQFQNIKDAF